MYTKDGLNGSNATATPFALISMVMGTEQALNVCMATMKTQAAHPINPSQLKTLLHTAHAKGTKAVNNEALPSKRTIKKGRKRTATAVVACAWQENAGLLHPKSVT